MYRCDLKSLNKYIIKLIDYDNADANDDDNDNPNSNDNKRTGVTAVLHQAITMVTGAAVGYLCLDATRCRKTLVVSSYLVPPFALSSQHDTLIIPWPLSLAMIEEVHKVREFWCHCLDFPAAVVYTYCFDEMHQKYAAHLYKQNRNI